MLDWGSLTRLYGFAPRPVQDAIAADAGLLGPQLASWMKSLNIIRNICAHHGRLFNRVHAIKPKMPPAGMVPALDEVRDRIVTVGEPHGSERGLSEHWFGERSFGQLTLVQHLLKAAGLGGDGAIPATMDQFPIVELMPIGTVGAPHDWRSLELWQFAQ